MGANGFGVNWLSLARNGELAAAASVDKTVRLWDLKAGKMLEVLLGQEGPVFAVAVSPDARHVVSGGRDGKLRVWARAKKRRLQVFHAHKGMIWSLVFTPDGKYLLSAGQDEVVRIWDLTRGKILGSLGATDDSVAAFRDSSDPGARLFRKCAACHSLRPDGGYKAGPTLHGLFGRRAGSLPGYPYSDAMRNATIVWTPETVAKLFELGPDDYTPGSKMPLQRIPSARDRAALVGFLKRVAGKDASP
jgi:cytochrome c